MVFRHPVPFPNGRAIVNYVYLPEDRNISGQRLRLTWLTENFPSLPLDVIVESMRCYDKAFILQLIGSFLFADKFNNKFIAPIRLHSVLHDGVLPQPPLGMCWRDEFCPTSTPMHVLPKYMYLLDRLMLEQIHLWTGPDTPNIGHHDEIHQLCAITLEAIHEADRFLIPSNVVDTKRQSSDENVVMRDGGVQIRGGGVWTRGGGMRTRGDGVQTRGLEIHEARLLIPPNVVDTERQLSDEEVGMRDGGVRTRGGGVRTRGGGV
ncbi:hypothetical protein CK203_070362 [Vitis vinifera]|uniref:Uncharacterized protein n=1 Tax=Vitis vinifera TaxID=29760 RepID=A0A438E6G7_VITVI|nr:hypothetical protein CK203_070362 [Vitis vinifera]